MTCGHISWHVTWWHRIACSIYFNTPWCAGFGLSLIVGSKKDSATSSLWRGWSRHLTPQKQSTYDFESNSSTLIHVQLDYVQDVKIYLAQCNTAMPHTVLSTYSRLFNISKALYRLFGSVFPTPLAVHCCASRIMASTCCPMSRAMSWWKSSPATQVFGRKQKHCDIMSPGITI